MKWENDNGDDFSFIELLLQWLKENDNCNKYRGAGHAGAYKTYSKDTLVKEFIENDNHLD